MPAKSLKIDNLDLDLENPRIKLANDQREVMQKIIDDQKVKIVNLAESIAAKGFSPIDRCLVMRSTKRKGHYTVLEGNRRVLAAKLLQNPSLVTDLEMAEGHRRRLHRACLAVNPKVIERIDCFVVADRTESVEWIRQRHSGEDEGRGIVGWSGVAVQRFRGRDAALQALDFVGAFAELTEGQASLIAGNKFPLTTLDRLLSTPAVRTALGFEVKEGKLMTELPPEEALKPLRRMVIDLAEKKKTVSDLKSKDQQIEYIDGMKAADRPNLTKRRGHLATIEGISANDFKGAAPVSTKRARSARTARTNVVPKSCKLNITNAKIGKIYGELRILQLSKHVHAIGVLLRVFLEMSVDDYLVSKAGSTLGVVKNGHTVDKKLAAKVQETINDMVSKGADRKDYKGILAGVGDDHQPFSIDTLHAYIHNRFFTPTDGNLVTGWDNAQRFFETIWP